MFDTLSERLQSALSDVRSRGTLTEDDINKAMRAIRLALLEADVNFQVVKRFTAAVKERALGADVLESLNPGQQVVKIVDEELAKLMGGASVGVTFSPRPPTVIATSDRPSAIESESQGSTSISPNREIPNRTAIPFGRL